jgi:hypothetical protein
MYSAPISAHASLTSLTPLKSVSAVLSAEVSVSSFTSVKKVVPSEKLQSTFSSSCVIVLAYG